MPDREKVVSGFEHCNKDGYAEEICPDCPYVDRNPSECVGQLMSDAIALLKEQEAVTPSWKQGKPSCGACDTRLLYKVFRQNYCHFCGKKVKWE